MNENIVRRKLNLQKEWHEATKTNILRASPLFFLV
jgi:hypothetical protein